MAACGGVASGVCAALYEAADWPWPVRWWRPRAARAGATSTQPARLPGGRISRGPAGPESSQGPRVGRVSEAAMDNSGKEAEAMALLAEAERKVKNSQSFFSGLFG